MRSNSNDNNIIPSSCCNFMFALIALADTSMKMVNNHGDVGRLVLWLTLMGVLLAALPVLALSTSMLRKDPIYSLHLTQNFYQNGC